jgi:hypothetical protein
MSMSSLRWMVLTVALSTIGWNSFVYSQDSAADKKPDASTPVNEDDKGWMPLLEKSSMEGWERTNFGGEGKVDFNDQGELVFEVGEPMTGITYKKDFPKENFEIRWEANRLSGSDFLAGLTFPVGEEHCSFICGGWGGGLIGISSIDGNDASENQTTQFQNLENKQWYKFVVRVDAEEIRVKMDDKEIIKIPRKGKSFSVRGEVRASRPLGYAVFRSQVAVRNFEYRSISAE